MTTRAADSLSAPTVDRPDLVARVRDGADRRAQLVLASPGYGKTGLLRSVETAYAREGRPVVWLLARDLARAAEEWARREGDRPTVVLVDDAHFADPAGCALLAAWMERPPASVALIVAASARIAVGASRLALQGRLDVLGEDDLRLDLADVARLLRLSGVEASLETAGEVLRRSEGWAAGAALLARALAARARGGGEATRDRTPSAVGRYLRETAFDDLPPLARRALVRASVADHLTPGLFARLTEGGDLFDYTEAGVFLLAGERASTWRFHRLYRDFLRERLCALGEGEMRRVNRLAAEWALAHDQPVEAASHALEAGDAAFLADALDRGARAFIAEGRIADALAWRCTPEIEGARPRTSLFHVTALALAGRLDEARVAAEAVRAEAVRPDTPHGAADFEAHLSYNDELIGFLSDRDRPSPPRLDALVRRTAGLRMPVHGEALLLQGLAYRRNGETAKARTTLEGALPHLDDTASWYAAVVAQATLAGLSRDAGDLAGARSRLRGLLDGYGDGEPRQPALAVARLGWSRIALDGGDVAVAAASLAKARSALSQLLSAECGAEAALLSGVIALSEGRHADAVERLSEGASVAARAGLTRLAGEATARHVQALLLQGERLRARDILEAARPPRRLGDARPSDAAISRLALTIAAGLHLSAEGRAAEAHRRLGEAQHLARTFGLRILEVEAGLALATAAFADGARDRALRLLRDAARLAAPCGLILPFRAGGALGLDLAGFALAKIEDADEAEGVGSFLRALLDGVPAPPRTSPPAASAAPGATELTRKELEILDLMALGRSNQQIADELFVSLATAKWHVRNVLAKLGAQNRSEAIARARRLRVLA